VFFAVVNIENWHGMDEKFLPKNLSERNACVCSNVLKFCRIFKATMQICLTKDTAQQLAVACHKMHKRSRIPEVQLVFPCRSLIQLLVCSFQYFVVMRTRNYSFFLSK
jgi:hypothetical protein